MNNDILYYIVTTLPIKHKCMFIHDILFAY